MQIFFQNWVGRFLISVNNIWQRWFLFLDTESWMRAYVSGSNTNCGNTGYRKLSSNGNGNYMYSGSWSYYGPNERCYWAVHAPGAKQIQFILHEFYVRYQLFQSALVSVYKRRGKRKTGVNGPVVWKITFINNFYFVKVSSKSGETGSGGQKIPVILPTWFSDRP